MPHKQKTKNKLTLGGEPLPGPEGQGPGAARCPHPLGAPRPPPHPWDVQKAPLAEAPVQVRGLPAACRPALPQQENRAGLFCLLPGPRAPGPHSPGAERRGNGPSAGGSGLCTQHTHRAHLSPRCTSEAGSRPGCPGRSQGCEQGPLGRGVRSRGGAVQAGPSGSWPRTPTAACRPSCTPTLLPRLAAPPTRRSLATCDFSPPPFPKHTQTRGGAGMRAEGRMSENRQPRPRPYSELGGDTGGPSGTLCARPPHTPTPSVKAPAAFCVANLVKVPSPCFAWCLYCSRCTAVRKGDAAARLPAVDVRGAPGVGLFLPLFIGILDRVCPRRQCPCACREHVRAHKCARACGVCTCAHPCARVCCTCGSARVCAHLCARACGGARGRARGARFHSVRRSCAGRRPHSQAARCHQRGRAGPHMRPHRCRV